MSQDDFDPDRDPAAGDPNEWVPVEPRRRRASGLVLSVRVSAELAKGLQLFAESQGISLSEAARHLLSDAVYSRQWSNTLNVRVTDRLSVTFGHTAPTMGGESKLRTAAELGVPRSLSA